MMINQWMSEFQKMKRPSQNYSIAELNMFFLSKTLQLQPLRHGVSHCDHV